MNTELIPAEILNEAYSGDINAQEVLACQYGIDIRPKKVEEDLKNMDICQVCKTSNGFIDENNNYINLRNGDLCHKCGSN